MVEKAAAHLICLLQVDHVRALEVVCIQLLDDLEAPRQQLTGGQLREERRQHGCGPAGRWPSGPTSSSTSRSRIACSGDDNSRSTTRIGWRRSGRDLEHVVGAVGGAHNQIGALARLVDLELLHQLARVDEQPGTAQRALVTQAEDVTRSHRTEATQSFLLAPTVGIKISIAAIASGALIEPP